MSSKISDKMSGNTRSAKLKGKNNNASSLQKESVRLSQGQPLPGHSKQTNKGKIIDPCFKRVYEKEVAKEKESKRRKKDSKILAASGNGGKKVNGKNVASVQTRSNKQDVAQELMNQFDVVDREFECDYKDHIMVDVNSSEDRELFPVESGEEGSMENESQG